MVPDHQSIMNVTFPDGFKCPGSRHDRAKIVLIDRQPNTLYQIRHEALMKDPMSLDLGSFIQLGTVTFEDRIAKTIHYLGAGTSNHGRQTITYEHLVIVAGLHHTFGCPDQLRDFCLGLKLLLKASKLQETLPQTILAPYPLPIEKKQHHLRPTAADRQKFHLLAQNSFSSSQDISGISDFMASSPLRFEVQI